MKPDAEQSPVRLATRLPEPISFLFNIEQSRDIDAPRILRDIIERNGGVLENGAADVAYQMTAAARSVEQSEEKEPPPVYRAEFPHRTIDGITETFSNVDRQLAKAFREAPEDPLVLRQINWHTGGTPCDPGTGSGGGPGARPVPYAGSITYMPPQPRAERYISKGAAKGDPVRLIIFDAWNRDDNEARRLSKSADAAGALLYSLNGFPNEDGFDAALDTYAANRENDPFPIPDHGVFVAAAAAQVAGWEECALHSSVLERVKNKKAREQLAALKGGIQLESVRVLGEYGVGDTYQLVRQLERVAASMRPGEKVVVNLSLVINTPPERFALRRLFGANHRRTPDALHMALHGAIRKLHSMGALIVAAAGNSSAGEAVRQRAQYPAAFDEVLAVTAATPDGSREAYYANRVFSKGVAVFGGTVKKDVRNGKIVVDEKFPLDGPFTDSKVPVYGEDPANESGQVLWAGTSFATPRVAALAARLWLAEPSLSNRDIMEKVRGCADSQLQCGTPYIAL